MRGKSLWLICALTATIVGAPMAAEAAPRSPDQTYAATCHLCHDTGIGPSIKTMHVPAEQISMIVRNGFGPMPPFSPAAISDSELRALAQQLSQGDAPGGGR